MRKESVNKYLKKFGIELHGSGYIKRLLGQQQNKDSFQSQLAIMNNKVGMIFDIGANKGFTTLKYLDLFPHAEIHSFEPFKDLFYLWEEITSKNPKVHFIPFGVSDKVGSVTFNINANHDTNSILATTKIGATSDLNCETLSSQTIDVLTIDEYCSTNGIDQIDIIKIDTQGSELAVLNGMENLLKEKKVKLIYTETYFKQQYVNQPLLFDIAKYLGQYGYFIQDMYDPFYNSKLLLWCDTIFLPE